MNKNHKPFIFSLILMVVVIVGFIAYQESIINSGDTIILETRPVDPRDLFRGEYVILRYKIENDDKILDKIKNIENNTDLYIKLTKDSLGMAIVEEVSTVKPEEFDGLWIKGKSDYRGVRFKSIEQFFVPEGSGKPIERIGSDLRVEVSLKNGESRIIRLLDKDLNAIDPNLYLQ